MNLHDFNSRRLEIETPSGKISYLDVGEGRPALFVHGAGTSSYLWRNVIDQLAGERRCVALDLPLHGGSKARTDQDFSLPALARLLEEFCGSLDLNQIDLVANDSGGAIAQVFAAHYAQRLATLTLTNCDTHDNLPPDGFRPTVNLAAKGALATVGAQSLTHLDLARSGTLGRGYESPDRLSDETIRAYLEPVFGNLQSARQFERFLTSLLSSDLVAVEPLLRKLTVPTLVVWGTADVFFELKWAYWLRDTIPGVTDVVELAGAKLFFPDERADDLVSALRAHWAGN
ncbi:MAG TPA: alpha/beta hydrolase [Micromonosporaceae bacterium]|nr:alpha/beta hydrolase [Micromonosporaceae bacterium]HCU50629.1 alpha/beta hydrolase [Micromonosporaceae bacterium]